jgi:rhodanese-related sulfurtransferase
VSADRRSIAAILAAARAGLDRVDADAAAAILATGGLLVDIRPVADRRRFGALPGAVVVERNVLEWRLDPASPDRLDGIDDGAYDRPIVVFCNDGYASSLAAADLQRLGLRRATDLVGGFNAWAASGHPVADRPAD